MNGDIVSHILNNLWYQVVQVTPMVIGAILLLLIGWILGRITRSIVREILKRFKADDYFKLGKKLGVSETISVGVSWIIYLAFIGATVDFLKIPTLSMFFNNIIDFIAGLLGGMIILIIGYAIAGYIQKQVMTTKTVYSEILAQTIFFFALIITIEMALRVVGLPTELLDSIVKIMVAAIGFGVAIALGLGLKDTVSQLAKKYLISK